VRSTETGRPTVEADPTSAAARAAASTLFTLVMLSAVSVVVAAILFLRIVLSSPGQPGGENVAPYAEFISSAVNAAQVTVMNAAYTYLAGFLAWWENPATPSEFENSLIFKNALFQLLNTFASLFYIAFVKASVDFQGTSQPCLRDNCLLELQEQLIVFIFLMIFFEVVFALLLPVLWRWALAAWRRARHCGSAELSDAYRAWRAAVHASPLERLADALPYSTFRGYVAIMLLFGLATVFVVSFSLAPTLVYVALILSTALDRNLVLTLTARPRPDGASTIGAWIYIFELLCYACTVTNLAVTAFASQGGSGPPCVFAPPARVGGAGAVWPLPRSRALHARPPAPLRPLLSLEQPRLWAEL
jgi:hypothetical protein